MSNGDSLDGFVFPPFIPPAAAARPADPPAPAPAPPAASNEPPAAAQTAAPGRMTMPWDVETPIVSSPADLPASAPATDDAEEEDLPWLERPAPREPVAETPPAEPAASATGEAFPDWLAWDDRDTDDARPESRGVAPVEGLQDFAPVDDLGGFVAPEPAVDWAEAGPPATENAAPEVVDASDWLLDAPDAAEPPVLADAGPEVVDSSDWALDAPEAAEPPVVADATPEVTFETPAAVDIDEPTFNVTLEDGAITFAPAAEADEGAPEPLADDAEPATAAEAHPFVADAEAVLSAEPNPFTAAAVHEAETDTLVDAVPAASAADTAPNGVFDEVAGRLEDIARTLRERPDALLSGAASDPLALLVAGYVMGYNARR
jgi:hypothetical protein